MKRSRFTQELIAVVRHEIPSPVSWLQSCSRIKRRSLLSVHHNALMAQRCPHPSVGRRAGHVLDITLAARTLQGQQFRGRCTAVSVWHRSFETLETTVRVLSPQAACHASSSCWATAAKKRSREFSATPYSVTGCQGGGTS
jgi:hypothetical protein